MIYRGCTYYSWDETDFCIKYPNGKVIVLICPDIPKNIGADIAADSRFNDHEWKPYTGLSQHKLGRFYD